MTRLLALALAILALASLAQAATITIEWAPGVGATAYDIEQSIDNGATWKVAKSVMTASVCTTTKCSTTYIPPATGLVLFRIVSYNAQGKSIRTHAGFWYCEQCILPGTASSAEITVIK